MLPAQTGPCPGASAGSDLWELPLPMPALGGAAAGLLQHLLPTAASEGCGEDCAALRFAVVYLE